MKKRHLDMTTVYTLGIYGLLLAGLLLLVLFGAGTYRRTVESQRENDNRRAVLSYLSMTLRNHDHLGAVAVEQGPEGDMLVLTDGEGEGAYATRIYLSGGRLVEEFSRADAAPGQGQVQSIGTCSQFDVEQLEDRQLRLRLDAGSVQVHLRSGSEGGQ